MAVSLFSGPQASDGGHQLLLFQFGKPWSRSPWSDSCLPASGVAPRWSRPDSWIGSLDSAARPPHRRSDHALTAMPVGMRSMVFFSEICLRVSCSTSSLLCQPLKLPLSVWHRGGGMGQVRLDVNLPPLESSSQKTPTK
jgi:hypothetical protein